MLKGNVINDLKRYLNLLHAEGIVVDKAYLYGSYLSGTNNVNSDIDVLLVMDKEDDYLAGKAWSLTRKINSRIEPFIIGKKRFYTDNDSVLIDLVKRTGLEIVV